MATVMAPWGMSCLPDISFEVRVPACLPPCQARGRLWRKPDRRHRPWIRTEKRDAEEGTRKRGQDRRRQRIGGAAPVAKRPAARTSGWPVDEQPEPILAAEF